MIAWIVLIAFLAQAQLLAGHMHGLAFGHGAAALADHDDDRPADPRGDLPCVPCQQLASAHHFIAASATALAARDVSFVSVVDGTQVPTLARTAAFDWLSRAPPAAA